MNPLLKEFADENQAYLRKVAWCLIILALIHLMPKAETPDNSIRFFLTVAYFGTIVSLLRLLWAPREQVVQEFVKKRFSDESDEMSRAARQIAFRVNNGFSILVRLGLVFVGSVGLMVVSVPGMPWIGFLESFHSLFTWGYYLSLAGILLFPYYYGGAILEVSKLVTQFREESVLSTRGGSVGGEALEVSRPLEFRAAGVDWSWSSLKRNVLVLGEIGSGKTWCVLNSLLDGLLRSGSPPFQSEPSGALILDPKGDYRNKLRTLCERLGRTNDLVEIDPDEADGITWNPLDSSDDELELAERFAAVMAARDPEAAKGEAFWSNETKKFLIHAIALIRMTKPAGEAPNFDEIYDLAISPDSILKRCEMLDLGIADKRIDNCLAYFTEEWQKLASETRSSIQAFVTSMLLPFKMSPYDRVFGGTSRFRLSEIIDSGKIFYFSIPVATRESMAKVICTLAKLEYYNEVLKPRSLDKSRPSLFFCDEFQVFFTTILGRGDADFFARSRQSNHVNVIACQNRPSMEKESPRKEVVDNLLGNIGIKVFLRNSEEQTNEWASKLFGEEYRGSQSVTSGQGGGKFKPAGGSVSAGAQRVRRVPPDRFSKLASPSKAGGVDWSESYIQVTGAEARGAELDVQPTVKYKWRGHSI